MIEAVLIILGALVCILTGSTCYFWARSNGYKQQLLESGIETHVEYFESVEDSSGVLKNSRRYIVKCQVYVDGLPVGGAQIVSEHLIEEFSYEKLKSLREEVFLPLVKVGAEVAASLYTKGGAVAGTVNSLVKRISKRKVG